MQNQIVLDAAELRRRGILRLGERTRGVMTWVDEAGRTTASIAYVADLVDARGGVARFLNCRRERGAQVP
jgi:hypothetical protein